MTQEKNHSQSNSLSNAKQCSSLDKNNFDRKAAENLHEALSKCLMAQRTYGKQVDDLPNIMLVFAECLSQYAQNEIQDAFSVHLRSSPDFPTPSDIIKILENKTNGRDKPNGFVYQRLVQRMRDGEQLNSSEYQYVKDYEAYYIS